jgi:hypothetical protein
MNYELRVSRYAKENLNPKNLRRSRSERDSFLDFGFYCAYLLTRNS